MLSFLVCMALAGMQAAATPVRRPAATTATAEIRVTDRTGNPLDGAVVAAEGPSSRESPTDADGRTTFRAMTAGTYRIRAVRQGFIALEKEITVRAAAPSVIEFALTAAPPPPPPPAPPPPPPAPPAPAQAPVTPGEPRVVDVPALAEKSLAGREPVRSFPIGCSGLSAAQLIVVRESIPITTHPNWDEVLYVVAGEATLNLDQRVQSISPGWLSVVPRGMPYSVARKGRNPVILLSIVGGQACAELMTALQR